MKKFDLHDQLAALRIGTFSAAEAMQSCQAIAASDSNHAAFRTLNPHALAQARLADPARPLAGLAISVKDLFDVQGEVSASSSPSLLGRAPATQDCPAVARVKAAGGILVGRTHMTELAFSGMGINPHFGTPINPQAAALAMAPRIPGGSSSGAAVSVATGGAWAALGSDTGGSLRIPAALCGLVGFKPTQAHVPRVGCNPLSYSMDSIGAITHSVRDARLLAEILRAEAMVNSSISLANCRFAVATNFMLDGLDTANREHFFGSIAKIRSAGARVEEVTLPPLEIMAGLNHRGSFSSSEVLSWLQAQGVWERAKHTMDPRVAVRILSAEAMHATDYVRLQQARLSWIADMQARLSGFDAVLSPTTPIVAAAFADVAPGTERDAEFHRVNGLMLRNTLPVNFLDGCGISIPNHPQGALATGLMLWHCANHDDSILAIAELIERLFDT